MLLVFGCAVFLLFVMPCILFGLGRMIAMATDGRARLAASSTPPAGHAAEQEAWFRRPMRPAFNGPRRPGHRVLRS